MVINRIANTTTASAGITMTKGIAAFASTVNAITIAPNTTNGERRNRRRNMLIPFCTWLMSFVIRLIKVEVPRVSISLKERVLIWANKSFRKSRPVETADFAAKYCAVIAKPNPMIPSRTRRAPIRHRYPAFFW